MYEYTFSRKRINEATVTITKPEHVVAATKTAFNGAETERLVVVALNTRNHIIGYETVYVGNVCMTLVRLGEVFRLPVRINASSIILLHNHPSGDTTPSPADYNLTTEAVKAGNILDIPLLDHVVVDGWGGFTSLQTMGVEMGRVS